MINDPKGIDALVGHNVRRLRLERAIDAASIAGLLETTEGAIENMEAGRQRFSAEDLRRLCSRYAVTPASFYSRDGT